MGKVKTVIHYAPAVSSNGGGIADAVLNLSKGLVNSGIHVMLFGGGKLPAKLVADVDYHILSMRSAVKLFNILNRQEQKDKVLHVHGAWSWQFIFLFIILKIVKVKVVFQAHGLLASNRIEKKSRFKKRLSWLLYQKSIFRCSKLLVATADKEIEEMSWANLGEKKYLVKPIGISPDFFETQDCYKPRSISLLFLSQIIPIKGLEMLLDSIYSLKNERDLNICLDIYGYGRGEYIQALKEKVIELRLDQQVRFMGKVEACERIETYDRYSWFVLPSYDESFGLAVVEALARGCKVLTTSGTPWKQNDFANINIVTPSKLDITEGLLSIVDTFNKCAPHSEWQDLVSVREKYNWASISKEMVLVYEELLDAN